VHPVREKSYKANPSRMLRGALASARPSMFALNAPKARLWSSGFLGAHTAPRRPVRHSGSRSSSSMALLPCIAAHCVAAETGGSALIMHGSTAWVAAQTVAVQAGALATGTWTGLALWTLASMCVYTGLSLSCSTRTCASLTVDSRKIVLTTCLRPLTRCLLQCGGRICMDSALELC
jgi:hypothetical protein